MSDATISSAATTPDVATERDADAGFSWRWIGMGLLPLVLLAIVLAIIVATDGGLGERNAPPIEVLNVSRVTLPEPDEIVLNVVNDGPDEITIAQVMVDDAYWTFTLSGDNTLRRLESTTITIPYPWVAGEAHAIGIISSTGIVFTADVPVAIESPQRNWATVARFALIGTYVGVIPVALGLLWYPFMRRLGAGPMRFILALTIGLLVFLVVDMWGEASEIALAAPGAFNAALILPIGALLAFMFLMAIGSRSRGEHDGLELAYRIALGIGLHNLGEGLAIGAAFALGEVALGVFLVIGFTLHNVTEGVGIAAPIVRKRPALKHFAGLALLAGAPAILGVWIGGFIFSPLWTTIFLAIGIGAIAQVIFEVWRIISRGSERSGLPALNWATFGGVAAGVAIMYATALLIAA